MRALLLPAVIFVATLISAGASAQSYTGLEISLNGKLRVASFTNNILFMKQPDGRIAGAAVDLGNFIARKLGVTFEPVVYANPESYTSSFGTGAWDIAIGPRTAATAEDADFGPDFILVDNIYLAAPGREFADATQLRSRRRQDRSRAERPTGFVADPRVEIRPARARAWWCTRTSSSCCAAARPTSSRQTAKSSTPRLTACRVLRSCPARSILSGWR